MASVVQRFSNSNSSVCTSSEFTLKSPHCFIGGIKVFPNFLNGKIVVIILKLSFWSALCHFVVLIDKVVLTYSVNSDQGKPDDIPDSRLDFPRDGSQKSDLWGFNQLLRALVIMFKSNVKLPPVLVDDIYSLYSVLASILLVLSQIEPRSLKKDRRNVGALHVTSLCSVLLHLYASNRFLRKE